MVRLHGPGLRCLFGRSRDEVPLFPVHLDGAFSIVPVHKAKSCKYLVRRSPITVKIPHSSIKDVPFFLMFLSPYKDSVTWNFEASIHLLASFGNI